MSYALKHSSTTTDLRDYLTINPMFYQHRNIIIYITYHVFRSLVANSDHGLLVLLVLLVVLVVLVMRRMVVNRMVMVMVLRRRWRRRRSCVDGYGEKGGPTERTGFRVYVDVDNSWVIIIL
jgi:hypothetical protein